MATAHVQTKDAQTASGTTLNVSLTSVGAGNHLVASDIVGAVSGLTSASPTAPSSTPTATWSNAVAAFAHAGGDVAGRMDYSENVASGSWTVTVKSNATHEITGLVSESSGVATSASLGAHNSGTSTAGTVQPGSITPASGSILYTATGDAGGSTTADTIDSSFAISSDATAWNGANQRGGQAHKDNVAATAVNPTWTLPAAVDSIAMIAEFQIAASGPQLASDADSAAETESTAQTLRVSTSGMGALRPQSDMSSGSWTPSAGGSLFAMLNETGDPNDTTFVLSSVGVTSDVAEVSLGTPSAPLDLTGTTGRLSYRYQGSVQGGRRVDLTVQLLCNGSVLQTWTHPAIQHTWLTATQTISAAVLATLPVPLTTPLSLRFTKTQV